MDLALSLWLRGYDALAAERARHGSGGTGGDAFVARLLGRRTLVVRGRRGAELFYDEELVRRGDAVPPPLGHLLFGRGAVHTLDGAEHRVRKQLFLDVLHPRRVEDLVGRADDLLAQRVTGWSGPVRLFDELVEVYGRAVLAWAGVPCSPAESSAVARDLATIVDGFGFAGLAYGRAWRARRRRDRWAADVVRRARAGAVTAEPGTGLEVLATGAGRDLPADVAGVELLNLLRPTVAVAWTSSLAVAALAARPEVWARFADPAEGVLHEDAVHETRRLCPFVPALAGRLRAPVEHAGVRVGPGDRIVLDVPGTDTDPAWWTAPDTFDAGRLGGTAPDPFAFVPQGGGDPADGHRCPGEPLTVALMVRTLRRLADSRVETVPGADLSVDRHRIPTLPAGGCPVRVSRA